MCYIIAQDINNVVSEKGNRSLSIRLVALFDTLEQVLSVARIPYNLTACHAVVMAKWPI